MRGAAILALILIFLCLIVIGPLITIWALNKLFHVGIEPSLATWFATLWLGGILAARASVKKS